MAAAQQIAHLESWESGLEPPFDQNPLSWSDEVFRIFGYQPGGAGEHRGVLPRIPTTAPATEHRGWRGPLPALLNCGGSREAAIPDILGTERDSRHDRPGAHRRG